MRSLLQTKLQKTLQHGALATAIVLSMGSVSAQAATPSDESVLQLMEVTHMADMMKSMLSPEGSENNMVQAIIQSQLQSDDLPDLNTEQYQQVKNIIIKNYSDMMRQAEPQLTQLAQQSFITAAKKYYTQEEVDAQLEFYGSAAGQSIIKKQPAVMTEYFTTIRPEVVSIMNQQMKQTMPKMVAELKATLTESED